MAVEADSGKAERKALQDTTTVSLKVEHLLVQRNDCSPSKILYMAHRL